MNRWCVAGNQSWCQIPIFQRNYSKKTLLPKTCGAFCQTHDAQLNVNSTSTWIPFHQEKKIGWCMFYSSMRIHQVVLCTRRHFNSIDHRKTFTWIPPDPGTSVLRIRGEGLPCETSEAGAPHDLLKKWLMSMNCINFSCVVWMFGMCSRIDREVVFVKLSCLNFKLSFLQYVEQ